MSNDIERLNKYPQVTGSPFPLDGGLQWLFRFPNGYGASVVNTSFSYSGDSTGELAVIKWDSSDDDDFRLVYDTPVTDDVLGWLTPSDVADILDQIRDLPVPKIDQLIRELDQ